MTHAELIALIADALDRISVSEPDDVVAMAAALMVAVDAIGPDAMHTSTAAELFDVFAMIFRYLTADE